ncbi:unnamed protein product, partial [Nesidiocoris tenuis]
MRNAPGIKAHQLFQAIRTGYCLRSSPIALVQVYKHLQYLRMSRRNAANVTSGREPVIQPTDAPSY